MVPSGVKREEGKPFSTRLLENGSIAVIDAYDGLYSFRGGEVQGPEINGIAVHGSAFREHWEQDLETIIDDLRPLEQREIEQSSVTEQLPRLDLPDDERRRFDTLIARFASNLGSSKSVAAMAILELLSNDLTDRNEIVVSQRGHRRRARAQGPAVV